MVLDQFRCHTGANFDIHLFSDPQQVQWREVNAFQTALTVVLQKTVREGFGLTVAEARWKGSAVIGGDCGGIRVLIQDGYNGFLIRTPEECARRTIQFIRESEVRKRMGGTDKESVRKQYLIQRLLRDYLQLIQEVGLEGPKWCIFYV